ncbi:MAG TPA: isoprenylcysteine carboxylmethyltransferase family protein [Anaerolineales bacterium]|nr:isoprenylcysteine carboxylmethyltransferase family protein [Anaerolineales bacterium]
MNNEAILRILLPLLLVTFAMHRGYYVRKHGPEQDTLKKREEGWTSRIAGILGLLGFIAVLIYAIHPGWLAWASLPVPLWLRWTGIGVAFLGFGLLQWAQNTLGRNWSDTPRMIKEQALVISGPYQFIRHPIYTAFLLILSSLLLVSSNWLIGLAWISMAVIEIASRIGFEEQLMLENFGDRYRAYMERTGRLLPRIV